MTNPEKLKVFVVHCETVKLLTCSNDILFLFLLHLLCNAVFARTPHSATAAGARIQHCGSVQCVPVQIFKHDTRITMHASSPWFKWTRTQMRRIHSDACIAGLWRVRMWDGSWRGANRDVLRLHMRSSRMFSHIVQMDPTVGHAANETAKNKKHVFGSCIKIWE